MSTGVFPNTLCFSLVQPTKRDEGRLRRRLDKGASLAEEARLTKLLLRQGRGTRLTKLLLCQGQKGKVPRSLTKHASQSACFAKGRRGPGALQRSA